MGHDAVGALEAADADPDDAERTTTYVALNKKLLGEYLPAVPISHSPPAIVVAGDVQGLIAEPVDRREVHTVYKN